MKTIHHNGERWYTDKRSIGQRVKDWFLWNPMGLAPCHLLRVGVQRTDSARRPGSLVASWTSTGLALLPVM